MYDPKKKLLPIKCHNCAKVFGYVYADPKSPMITDPIICCKKKPSCIKSFEEKVLPKIEIVEENDGKKEKNTV